MNIWLVMLLMLIGFAFICIVVAYFASWQDKRWKKQVGIENNDPKSYKKFLMKQRWENQEKKDKAILESNLSLKNQLETAFNLISVNWDLIKEGIYTDKKNNAELCIRMLTPTLFLKKYELFKSGDRDMIKDGIFQERPYFTHETLIDIGLYVFETKQNINILNFIANSKDYSLVTQEDILMAKELLKKEHNDYKFNKS